MARKLPPLGGVCMNAESEIEAVGMVWGAAATGVRAATGSVGQGLSLMQESLAEAAVARLPFVVLNMARSQADYFQATRGGGHGDYRLPVLAPMDVPEAAQLVQVAFDWADRWRNPVLVYGDYFLAHTAQSVEVTPLAAPPLPPKTWALDGSSGGSGRAKLLSPLGEVKQRDHVEYDLGEYYRLVGDAWRAMASGIEPMVETGFIEGAEMVVVAFGSPARFVRYVVAELRAEGWPVGYVRPITLYPFPSETIARLAGQVRAIAVYENSAGQMIDDVRLAVLGATPVEFIGGLTMDSSAFGVGPDLDVTVIRRRVEAVLGAYGAAPEAAT
jgi:2-oxoglutarate ferredoxin oxidoreductase subunit alpha